MQERNINFHLSGTIYSGNNDHRSSNETIENKGTPSWDKNTVKNEQGEC